MFTSAYSGNDMGKDKSVYLSYVVFMGVAL